MMFYEKYGTSSLIGWQAHNVQGGGQNGPLLPLQPTIILTSRPLEMIQVCKDHTPSI